MDQIHDYMRLHHYSIHTERSYCDWIRRFILFHKMTSRNDFADGEVKIERFLTHLAVSEDVAPATQNQAMNALVFLYCKILAADLDQKIDAVRAKRRKNIPVVMTREAVRVVILLMKGTAQSIVKLLYGSGLRIIRKPFGGVCKTSILIIEPSPYAPAKAIKIAFPLKIKNRSIGRHPAQATKSGFACRPWAVVAAKTARAAALTSADVRPTVRIPPCCHNTPPLRAPVIRPRPAAAKKPDTMLARFCG